MARLFDDGSNEYLEIDSVPFARSYPATFACRFRVDADGIDPMLMTMVDKSRPDEMMVMYANMSAVGNPLSVFMRNTSVNVISTSTGISVGTWHHGCVVFTDETDISVFLDGGGEGNGTGDAAITDLDRVSIGRVGDSNPGNYMSGDIAEPAIWDGGISNAEVAVLAADYSPLFVRPQNLVAYWPLVRGLNDIVGGFDMVASGTVVSAHPRIIRPAVFNLGLTIVGGVTRQLAGSLNSASQLTGLLNLTQRLSGNLNSTSHASGILRLIQRLSGSLNSSSVVSGTIRLVHGLSGAVQSASQVAGSLRLTQRIKGALNSISALTGILRLIQRISGSLNSITHLSGDLHVPTTHNLSGSLNSTSHLSGTLTEDRIQEIILASGTRTLQLTASGTRTTQLTASGYRTLQLTASGTKE